MAKFGREQPDTEVSDGIFIYESTESEYQDRLEFVKHQIKSVQNAASKNNEALTQAIEDTESP